MFEKNYKYRFTKSSKGDQSLFTPVAVNDVKLGFDDSLLERVISTLK